jgi:hypothetical protein
MKQSLKEDIIRFLAHTQQWHNKGELLLRAWKYPDGRTYMSDTVSRKLREAESESRIAVKYDEEGSCIYKFLPVEKRKDYQPWSLRVNKDELFK